jgi:hypothetical protein
MHAHDGIHFSETNVSTVRGQGTWVGLFDCQIIRCLVFFFVVLEEMIHVLETNWFRLYGILGHWLTWIESLYERISSLGWVLYRESWCVKGGERIWLSRWAELQFEILENDNLGWERDGRGRNEDRYAHWLNLMGPKFMFPTHCLFQRERTRSSGRASSRMNTNTQY